MNGKHGYLKNLLLFTQLGLSVVSPVLVCAAIGWALMKYLNAHPVWMVILILIGVASGVLSALSLVRKMLRISENGRREKNGDGKEEIKEEIEKENKA